MSHACVLMNYWAGLYASDDKKAIEDGVETMLKIAVKLLAKKSRTDVDRALEEGNTRDSE